MKTEQKLRGDGRIYTRPDSRFFWCEIWLNGKPNRESTGCTEELSALKYLRGRTKERSIEELGVGVFATRKMRKVAVAALIDGLERRYEIDKKLSAQNKNEIKRARAAFGHFRALAFGATQVDAFIKQQLADGYANATINRTLTIVRAAFNQAAKEGTIARKPYIRALDEDNVRQGFLTRPQLNVLLKHLPADLADLTEAGFATGMRRGELVGMTWDNLRNGDTMIVLESWQTKNRRGRSLPVEGTFADVIKRRRQAQVIKTKDGSTSIARYIFHRGDGLQIGDFRKTWQGACTAGGLKATLFHDLRRSAVCGLVNSGASNLVARRISGHESDSVFDRYAISVQDAQKDALVRRDAYDAKQVAEAAEREATNVLPMVQQG